MTRKTQEACRMFGVGSGFWKGSKILSNYLGRTKDFDLAPPIFVNMSFAGEVYLKCLLLKRTGKYPRGHDLKDLFDKLPPKDQAPIEDAYKNIVENSPVFRHLMKGQSVPKLSTVLAGAGKTFSKMRYSFECEKGPPSPTVMLQEFIEAVQERLLAIDPKLKQVLMYF